MLALAISAFGEDKPIVVFTRPADCFNDKLKIDPCATFIASVAHPAMQRRLAAVDFRVETGGEETSIAVQSPTGREAMRWQLVPTWVNLADILTLLDGAAPHLMRSHAATGDAERDREWALAVLALGDRAGGRALLQSMRGSPLAENRELAAIWLERLDTLRSEGALMKLARGGATERVRFEAWMALGDLRVEALEYERAIDAFDEAVKLAATGSPGRRNALSARQRAATLAAPVLGLGPPGSVVAGRRTVQPRGIGKAAKRVEFMLDGRTVATSRRAPFAAGIDFGRIPRRQILEVIARDGKGNAIKRSRVVINERSDAFDVEIVEPATHELSGEVDVVVAARVPDGRYVDRVTIEWNGDAVARLTAPPYRTRFNVRPGDTGVLRAVLRLDDGSETEDVLLVNTSTLVMEAGAHLVELPAYFEGTPAPRDVIVRENGKQRMVEEIVRPEDAPLIIGLLIDSSGSMTEHMLDVQEAALRFAENHLDARDKAMIVTFDSNAQVRLRPSTDRALFEKTILRMRPRGGTALNDAIITALLQLQASGSRRALVVFSDGFDVSSVFSSGDAAEVARRAGVPIYVLAFTPELGPQAARIGRSAPLVPLAAQVIETAKKELMAISERTGAKAFDMRTLEDLGALWAEIGADLRRQSLLIYRTETAGAEWRPLEVSVKGGGAVRAPAGVYVTAREAR